MDLQTGSHLSWHSSLLTGCFFYLSLTNFRSFPSSQRFRMTSSFLSEPAAAALPLGFCSLSTRADRITDQEASAFWIEVTNVPLGGTFSHSGTFSGIKKSWTLNKMNKMTRGKSLQGKWVRLRSSSLEWILQKKQQQNSEGGCGCRSTLGDICGPRRNEQDGEN